MKFKPFEQDRSYVSATLRSVDKYRRGIGLTAGWERGHERLASFCSTYYHFTLVFLSTF